MTPLRLHATESNIRQRLEQDLSTALSRLRRLGEVVELEAELGAIGDNTPFADAVDDIQASASREISMATRELVIKHVQRLSTALRRLHEGEYGVCADCAEPISPARLRALPEVHTCVRCQDALECRGRRSAGSPRSAFAMGEDALAGAASHASCARRTLPASIAMHDEPRVLDAPATRPSEPIWTASEVASVSDRLVAAIVDDDPSVRRALQRVVEAGGIPHHAD